MLIRHAPPLAIQELLWDAFLADDISLMNFSHPVEWVTFTGLGVFTSATPSQSKFSVQR